MVGIYDVISNKIQTKSDFDIPNKQLVGISDAINKKQKEDPLFKYRFPQYLYRPYFGYPRNINVPFLRQVSKNIYYESILSSIKEAVSLAEWDIVPKDGVTIDVQEMEKDRLYIKNFFLNPNDDDESYECFVKKIVDDLLVLDAGCINKVYNFKSKLTQIRAIDGGTITKNPDEYGRLTDREDIIFSNIRAPLDIGRLSTSYEGAVKTMNDYGKSYDGRAAYFQYSSYIQFSVPVPFGKKEIVYMTLNPTSENVYSKTSKVQSSIELALNLIYGSKYNLDFYINGNTPEGLISIDGFNSEQAKAFKSKLSESMSDVDETLGTTRRVGWRMPVVGAKAEFVPLNFSSREMEIITQQKWFHRVLLMIFGLTSDYMGITETSNKTNGDKQDEISEKKAIKPILNSLSYYFTNILQELPNGKYFKFKFNDFDKDEYLKQLSIYQQELELGITTPDIIAKQEDKDIVALQKYRQEQYEKYDKNRENNQDDEKTETKSDDYELKDLCCGEDFEVVDIKGEKKTLNKPFRLPSGSTKKFGVYVRNGDSIKKVTFGDPNMEIRRDNPEARKNFRARHNCDTAKDKTSAKYWSCKMWSKTNVSNMTKSELKSEHNMPDNLELENIISEIELEITNKTSNLTNGKATK